MVLTTPTLYSALGVYTVVVLCLSCTRHCHWQANASFAEKKLRASRKRKGFWNPLKNGRGGALSSSMLLSISRGSQQTTCRVYCSCSLGAFRDRYYIFSIIIITVNLNVFRFSCFPLVIACRCVEKEIHFYCTTSSCCETLLSWLYIFILQTLVAVPFCSLLA